MVLNRINRTTMTQIISYLIQLRIVDRAHLLGMNRSRTAYLLN
jgi:hypothetical protein